MHYFRLYPDPCRFSKEYLKEITAGSDVRRLILRITINKKRKPKRLPLNFYFLFLPSSYIFCTLSYTSSGRSVQPLTMGKSISPALSGKVQAVSFL